MGTHARQAFLIFTVSVLMVFSGSPGIRVEGREAVDDQKVRDAKRIVADWIASNEQMLNGISDDIWRNAELSFEEVKTTKIMVDALKRGGFSVETGLAKMPTSFVATYGSGKPVIGILAELDALPNMSQETVPYKKPLTTNAVGHGCQHNLVAASSIATAMGLKEAIDRLKLPGTIKVFGPPAEEVFFGKIYMIKAGMFNDVDVCLSWHSDTETNARYNASAAIDTIRVRFHAKGGENPLTDLKQFDANVDYLRKTLQAGQVISEPAIIKGGGRPGLSPDMVEAWYSLRTFDRPSVEAIFDKVNAIIDFQNKTMNAGGEVERINGVYPRLPLPSLVNIIDRNLREHWPPKFTEQDREFARKLQEDYRKDHPSYNPPGPLHEGVLGPPIKEPKSAGNDNGDVSWVVPLAALSGGSRPWLMASHSWHNTAAAGMGIGHKVMILMGKTLGGVAIDLMMRPEELKAVSAEFRERTNGFVYKPYVPDEPPAQFYQELNKIFESRHQ